MRKMAMLCVAVLLSQAAAAAPPPSSPGVGVVVGDPTGGTLRVFLNAGQSLDFGVGYSGDAALWGDYTWHDWDLLPRPKSGETELWVSAGLRLETASDTEFGFRTMLGASYWLPGRPVELFASAGPVFQVAPDGGVGADGGVGLRFYFGGLDGR
ncbi:MAG: hypothetical protein HY928_12225 [Elusimicrobia bacterium]|nr:hypothetical protein [Elusimicrobiota bacterium]